LFEASINSLFLHLFVQIFSKGHGWKNPEDIYLNLQPDWRMKAKPDKAKYSVLILTDGKMAPSL
jgi:hypothetical protein